MKKIRFAIVGATGAVGRTALSILEQSNLAIEELVLLASSRSMGQELSFRGNNIPVLDLAHYDFYGIDVAIFSAGSSVSEKYVPRATDAGCIVIDNTSHFRYQSDVPLVVPEINGAKIAEYKKRNIIANPNCSTIIMLLAINPIYDAVGVERINVATYQSVSGAGQRAIKELTNQATDILSEKRSDPTVFNKQIAFNVIPQIDVFLENNYTKEEMKMVWETKKILSDERIGVNATAVRVPVYYGHSEAVHLETREKLSVESARELLRNAPGVVVYDDLDCPTPCTHADGRDAVAVGRIRKDITHPKGINFWVVGDNIRKGAALNSVQIASQLVDRYL